MKRQINAWMGQATTQQKAALARLAGTSVGYLYHLAAGRKIAGPELAEKIANASKAKQFEGLPKLLKENICPACAGCDFVKRATGA
jgi:hypothetical protein